MQSPPVDIIISIYTGGAHLDETISSLRSSCYPNFTLWILDKSDNDVARNCVLRHGDQDRRIVYRRVPMGTLGTTRNYGVTLSSAPYLLFINDDCIVEQQWITECIAELTNPETWIVFGRVLPGAKAPAGTEDTGVVIATKLNKKRQVYRGNRFNLGFGQGHNMGVRRERFEQLGGFDEYLSSTYLGVWDERDLGYRALRLGGQIVYNPKAVVYHCHWQPWSGAAQSSRKYALGAGAAVAKYLQCGDRLAIYLLLEWMLSQGVRQAFSGMLKWRHQHRVRLALGQLYYPWIGLLRGLNQPCDKHYILFRRVTDSHANTQLLLGDPTDKEH